MTRLLGQSATLVSYGAMSKQPLSLPTSLFIFKELRSVGFWLSRWYTEKTLEEREKLIKILVDLMASGKVRTSPNIFHFTITDSDIIHS